MSQPKKALAVGPFSVMQKERVPPSGDKHDFLTLAPYVVAGFNQSRAVDLTRGATAKPIPNRSAAPTMRRLCRCMRR